MATRYITWSLVILFLLPLTTLPRRTDTQDLTFDAVLFIVLTVIPLIGLWSQQAWFFYYVYVVAAIFLLITFFAFWFGGLFGDENLSILQLALALWPLELYFGVTMFMVAILHKRRIASENKMPVR